MHELIEDRSHAAVKTNNLFFTLLRNRNNKIMGIEKAAYMSCIHYMYKFLNVCIHHHRIQTIQCWNCKKHIPVFPSASDLDREAPMLTSSLLGSVTLSLVIATIRGVLPALFVTSQSWREGVSKGEGR